MASTETQPEQPDASRDEAPEPRLGRRRRAPRYGSFVATGAIVGLIVGLILATARPSTGQFSQNTVIGYVAAIFGLLGALAGAAAAIYFDSKKPKIPRP